jgi:hypothetical protein
MLQNNALIIILFILNLLSFGMGYIIGKITNLGGVYYNEREHKPQSFFDKPTNNRPKIEINDDKYVVEIKTDGLEKKFNEFADIKKSNENITNSVNKLKNMKG